MVNILNILERTLPKGQSKVCRDVWNEFCFSFVFDRLFASKRSLNLSIDIAFFRFIDQVRISSISFQCLSHECPWIKRILRCENRSIAIYKAIMTRNENHSGSKTFLNQAIPLIQWVYSS